MKTRQQRYAELMHSRKTEYIGRYTVPEFGHCKASLYGAKGQAYGGPLTHRQVEDICRYVAKNDWPAERDQVYLRAVEFAAEGLLSLEFYDMAQEFFDKLHHGPLYFRQWKLLPKKVLNEISRQLGE